MEGQWANGEFEGDHNTFYYPDGSYVTGKVVEGEWVNGAYYTSTGKRIKTLKVDIVNRDEMPEFKNDRDPYETNFIEVKQAGK